MSSPGEIRVAVAEGDRLLDYAIHRPGAPDGVEDAHRAQARDVAGIFRDIEGDPDMTLGTQVVDFVRLKLIHQLYHLDRIRQIGNSAGVGASLMLLSEDERRTASELGLAINHIELSLQDGFRRLFARSQWFPEEST